MPSRRPVDQQSSFRRWAAASAGVLAVLVVLSVALGPAVSLAAARVTAASHHASSANRGSHHRGKRLHHHKKRHRKTKKKRKKKTTVAQQACDIYARGNTRCVAAYSSTHALFANYDGPLYEVKRASDSATLNVGVLTRGGYANAAAQDGFCAKTTCIVQKIYDQTSNHNDLVPQGPTTEPYSNTTFDHDPVSANALPVVAGGHDVYGLKFQSGSPTTLPCPTAGTCIENHGEAYNNANARAKGVAVDGQAESMYGVFGGTYSGSDCCFDFGNSEVHGTDDGNGTMDALNFSRDCWDACGPNGGPWVQADLENGMFMTGSPTPTPDSPSAFLGGSFQAGDGFCCATTSQNLAMPDPFVTAMLNNPGSRTFEIEGASATTGRLTTFYNGPTPPGPGYSPMRQEGGIILGSGGDQGTTDGEFFEGAMTIGVPSAATEAAVQASIVKVGYKTR